MHQRRCVGSPPGQIVLTKAASEMRSSVKVTGFGLVIENLPGGKIADIAKKLAQESDTFDIAVGDSP